MTVGILALQGDVREHAAAMAELGVATRPVRRPGDLDGLRAVILPGGESTTLSMLLDSSGLRPALAGALADGLPALGTCAGLVLLAVRVLDGRPDQHGFGVLDCVVRRNGYGRQLQSFEGEVRPEGSLGGPGAAPLPAVFIRAPVVESTGPGVEVLARLGATHDRPGAVVACRQGPVLATAFHPELTGDRRVHRLLAELAGAAPPARRPPAVDGAARR